MSDEMKVRSHAVGWWQPVIFGAMAGGLGWGIRGQYGHETGAMIAGVLVCLTLAFLLCPGISSIQLVRAAALGTIAMGIGGSMTYGVTLGLTQNPEVVGNWAALRWGLLGCLVKGAIWIGFGGLFLGMGLGGKRYTPREILALVLAMLVASVLGGWLLNGPFDIAERRFPTLFFSSVWYWDPESTSRPRPESWGSLGAALLLAWVYCAWRKKDVLARNMGLWGLLGGALGFPLGQSLQAYHAWNPAVFQQGIWVNLDQYMNWWNNMETTFGCIMGAILGLGLWLNRRRIDLTPESNEKNMPYGLEAVLLAVHVFLLTWMTFFAGPAELIYDFGINMALLPFVCVIRGRLWPWFMVLTVTLVPIAAKTVTQLVTKQEILGTVPGWFIYFLIPILLVTALAFWAARRWKQGRDPRNFIMIALLCNVWLYFGLNYAVFRFPWPWADWTGRTPNGLVFTLFAVGLTGMVLLGAKRAKVERRGTSEA